MEIIQVCGAYPSQEAVSEECCLSAFGFSILFVSFLSFDVIQVFTGEGTTKVLYASSGDGTL